MKFWSSQSHVPLAGSFNRIEIDANGNIIMLPGAGKKIGMNVAVPTGKVHLAAGEGGVGLGALKFTVAGAALLTAPEVGVLEPMTDDLYYTITTGIARKPIVMTDGFPLTAGRVPYATTNGRLTDSNNLTNDGVSVIVTGIAATDLPTYGAEILTTAGWTVTAGWTEAPDDVFTHAVGITTLDHSAAIVAAARYQVSWAVSGYVSGSFSIDFGGINIPIISSTGAFGPTTINTNTLVITPTNDFVGEISLISLKRIMSRSTPVVYLKNSTPDVRVEMRATKERYNTFVGEGTGGYDTTGKYNDGFGMQCLNSITSGEANVGVGTFAVYANTTGMHNIGIGFAPLIGNVAGNYNVAVGGNALYNNLTGSSNIAIGFEAGYWETGSNKLFIDNGQRTNEADARIKALMYGVFASLTANQYLTINANLKVLEAFGCNGAAVQTAYVSGGALAAYGAGTKGLDTDVNMSALHAMVVSIRACLVANGMMS